MSYLSPRLEIYVDRIRENARSIIDLCHSRGIKVACVSKAVRAHSAVVKAMIEAGADLLADSRIPNIAAIKDWGDTPPRMLLRGPSPFEASDVIGVADISLNTSLDTLKALSEATCNKRLVHKIVVMVDLGDLREGIWPDRVPEFVRKAKDLKGIEIIGIGGNLTCYGGVVPSEENLDLLVETHRNCQRESGLELPLLSGGNSSCLPLLISKKIPESINQLRIGETIILGRNVIDRSPFPATRQDTFMASAAILEMESKPSVPLGNCGQDAFGKTGFLKIDKGIRRRAICNLGRQDAPLEGLVPVDPGIFVLGGTSDHLLLDVEEATTPVKVGGEVLFYPNYGALLGLFTSPYVQKVVKEGF